MTKNSIIKHGVRGLFATGLVAMLVACGGGGSSSSDDDSSGGSVSVASRGVITQLGSIHVNGVKYETPDGNSYSSDDSTSTVANYQVGQVVSLRGRRNDDGVTGTADEVEYEAEIEGEANAGDINGITVLFTPKTNAPGIPSLVTGTRYEVSGIWIDDFNIEATFVKQDDDGGAGDTIDEIKGKVQVVNSASSFDVRDITFNMAGAVPHGVAVDNLVEVHFDSCAGTAPDIVCIASSVEIEDDVFDMAEGLEVEIEGAVDKNPAGCPPAADFKVDGVCIDSSSKPALWMDGLTMFDDMVQGSRVEAEGHMIGTAPNHYLRADKVKGRGNRVRVSSVAGTVNAAAGTFALIDGNISVTTMAGVTEFEDGLFIDTVTPAENIDGQTVEVRGVRTGPSELLALRIKLTGLSGGGDRHELRAEIDESGTNSTNDTITVMGIVSMADENTELEVEDIEIAPGNGLTTPQAIDDFLLMVDADADPSNGPRDVVEIGVDITTGDGSGGLPYSADEWEIEEEDD
jgi:hypothetical protein